MNKRDNMGFLIFITFVVIVLFILKINDQRRTKLLTMNGIYSIAKIELRSHYRAGGNTGSSKSSKVEYSFLINKKCYEDSHSAGIPTGVNKGNKYFLLVDKNDFTKTEIFFDRPINDSLDFERYVKEFDKIRKNTVNIFTNKKN
jgi:hypothetical protein